MITPRTKTEVWFWCRGPYTHTLYRSISDHDSDHTDGSCTLVQQTTVTITLEEVVSRETAATTP